MSDELVQSTPAGGETLAPAVPAPATPTAAPPSVGAPQIPQSMPATPNIPDGYVPSYRLREARESAVREANQRAESQMAQVRAELDRYKSQIQALVGVTPPQNTEADTIRQQFFQLFPWAKKMEDRFGDVEQLMEKAGDMEAQNNHYWAAYGKQNMDRLFSLAAEGLGAPLTDEGKRQLHSSFIGFLQSSPELTQRYASDPSVVEDFWKQLSANFIDPVRRSAAAGVANRAAGIQRLPQDAPSGSPQLSPIPKLNGLDERVAAGWAEYKAKTGLG